MAGTARPNSPEGTHLAPVKVRRLQNRLWAAAKQSEGRRFHALYDRIYRNDVLWEAWERVRANRGAAGVDALTLAAVEAYGVERMLAELQERLRAGIYRPAPVRRVEIPKPDGSKRPLGIPTVEGPSVPSRRPRSSSNPSSRPTSCPASFGFRPKRSATDAMERIRVGFIEGRQFVFEADIRDFFGEIDHEQIAVAGRGAGVGPTGAQAAAPVAACRGVGRWGGLRDGHGDSPGRGHLTAPGQHLPARLRPGLGRAWHRRSRPLCGRLRGAVHVPGSRPSRPSERATAILGDLGLSLHPDKTRVVDLREGKEGFDFLGCHLHARMSGKLWEQRRIIRYYLHRWPSVRSMKRARAEDQGPHRSKPGRTGVGGRHRTAEPVPSGMGQLLPHRECGRQVRLDGPLRCVAAEALAHQEAGPQPAAGQADRWTRTWFHDQGLHKLMGTIRYPKAA